MLSLKIYSFISVIICVFSSKLCLAEMLLQPQPSLYLYSPGELEFTDVLVKQAGDNLTLECELRGDSVQVYVWSYLPHDTNLTQKPYKVERNATGSRLLKYDLVDADSGRYVCSAPPFSQAKYILVQPHSDMTCAHGAFICGKRCVLPAYVCDGRRDCEAGEDEAPDLCGHMPCARTDRLNCSSGRCIPEAACCRTPHALCRQPACCEEHPRYGLRGAFLDVDMPPVFDDRHAPDDYGFIQSTIYTVTACALIFMIAVVLLVSAICKMHMKRAALRSYAHADGRTRAHYSLHYAQIAERHRFPPCYEASGLLETAARSPLPSPVHETQCGVSAGSCSPSPSERGTRLAALTSVFTSRYRQVPTQCTEVEMTGVTSTAASSPSRSLEYRSPAGGRLSEGAPHLNAPAEPVQPDRLTLQLGRFQLSIPRFGRSETRPDTPNVAEVNIDDLDFVRLNSNETYTLNGRTIRLLGGNFENYPPLSHGSHPPPYNEAMRYKLYGPPPEYLSRDRLNRTNSVDEEARSNVEMPPCYDELSANVSNGNASNDNGNRNGDASASNNPIVMNRNLIIMSNIIESVCNDTGIISNELRNSLTNIGEASGSDTNNGASSSINNDSIVISEINDATTNNNGGLNLIKSQNNGRRILKETSINNNNDCVNDNGNVETLNSVIDNLPAIDSDVNANDSVVASIGC